jgi:hypothetical protein
MIKLKEILLKEQATKSDIKKMERMANDITKQMQKYTKKLQKESI